MTWRETEKRQPSQTMFRVAAVDAPNVHGARMQELIHDSTPHVALGRLRASVEAGRVSALYVFDPGPAESLGETDWIVDARAAGTLPLLVVQGVLMTDLARAADFVLPGASFVEKEASYTNDQGRLQGTTRAIPAPGEAMEDWQLLVNLARALGGSFTYESAADVRADIEARFPAVKASGVTFAPPIAARHWLQASNPSERWKWDFMFQDLPPVKGAVDPSSLPVPPGMIPLKEIR